MIKLSWLIIVLVIMMGGSSDCSELLAKRVVVDKAPNIVFIFPDQLRRHAANFWTKEPYRSHLVGKADPVYTPVMDRLAYEGVVVTNAISNSPVCSPYRAMLLSGKYPSTNGVHTNVKKGRNIGLSNQEQTITDVYAKAGYSVGYFGKCHWEKNQPFFDDSKNYVGPNSPKGGYHANSFDTYIPAGRGRHSIDYFYQSLGDRHSNYVAYSNDPMTINGRADGVAVRMNVFNSKKESEVLIDYIKNSRSQRDENKPFLAIWSPNPPHSSWGKKDQEQFIFDRYYSPQVLAKDKLIVRKNVDAQKITENQMRAYFTHITSVDRYIGQVLEALKRKKILDNTIIVITSDHGEFLGSHGRTGKGLILEEAYGIPLIIRYPKKIKPGSISNAFINVPDILPTLLGLSGKESLIAKDLEGKNKADLLVNNKNSKDQVSPLFQNNEARGLKTDRYTLHIGLKKSESYFYDNQVDPYQLNKITLEQQPKVSAKLTERLGSILKSINDVWYKRGFRSDVIKYPSS